MIDSFIDRCIYVTFKIVFICINCICSAAVQIGSIQNRAAKSLKFPNVSPYTTIRSKPRSSVARDIAGAIRPHRNLHANDMELWRCRD